MEPRPNAHVSTSLRPAIRIAGVATLVAGIGLFLYATLRVLDVPAEMAGKLRQQMVIGAIVATICLFPSLLFVTRFTQWATQGVPHPSVPMALIAALSLFPLIISLGMLFGR